MTKENPLRARRPHYDLSRGSVSIRRVLGHAALLLLCVSLGSASAWAEESDRVAAIEAWVEAFNRGVEAMIEVRKGYYESFDLEAPGAMDWQPQFESMRDDLAPISLQGLEVTGGPTLEALVDSSNGPLTLSFQFSDEDRITGLQIEMGHSSESSLPPLQLPVGGADPTPVITEYLEALVPQDLFAGSVLIAKPSGEIIYQRAFGLASREFGVPNQLSTRFDVGSINKDYTHVGLLMLAKEGKIDLAAKVGKYLPEYPHVRVRDEVTIQQLIDHRGGVPDYFDDEWATTPMRTLRDIDDYLPIWADRPLLAEPGERESYSNYGYTILGAIIEAVSGQSYPEFVQQRIFGPLGMTGSGFFAVDGVEPNVAVGYTHMNPDYEFGEALWKNIFLEPAVGGPWGKSYSPIVDLFRFYQKLFRHQILEPGEAWFGDGDFDGFGVALGGGGPGLSSMMWLEKGWMVIALSNLDTPSADAVAEVLMSAVTEPEREE
ncbi:MAG: beta-lactamase family protein [Thermoanaerobaculia bacterium]|nr:beta-lactamase family protein [Thermoanaerobaculia bacterium]